MEQTNQLSLIEKPDTAERFAKIYAAVHGCNIEQAAQMFEVEKFSFKRELEEKAIDGVTELSTMGVFIDVVSNGLSFSGQMKHVYLTSRNVKTGRKHEGKDVYEKRLVFSPAPDGRIFLAQKAGSIERTTKPIIVYEGDDFGISTDANGKPIILHKPKFPRNPKAKAIAGYIYIVFPDGEREPYWLEEADITRLAQYSSRNNRKWNNGQWENGPANALYYSQNGGIDSGFFGAKLINYALKNIRRAGLRTENEVEDVEYEMQPDAPSSFTPDPPSQENGIDQLPETF